MKFCLNTSFTLPKQSQRSRSALYDGSRLLGLFGNEKKTLFYNQRNTVHVNIKLFFCLSACYSCLGQSNDSLIW